MNGRFGNHATSGDRLPGTLMAPRGAGAKFLKVGDGLRAVPEGGRFLNRPYAERRGRDTHEMRVLRVRE